MLAKGFREDRVAGMRILGLVCIVLALLVAVTGCNTFDRRARQKAEVFNALDTEARERLREGIIKIGDSMDMVYIALGNPDAVRRSVRVEADDEVWVYKRFYQVFSGYYYTYNERRYVYDAKAKTYRVYIVPTREPVWETRSEDYLRIGFRNGVVEFVEEGK